MIIGSGPAADAAKKAAEQVGYVTQARGVAPAPVPQAPTEELLQQGALVQHDGIQRNDGAEWEWDWEAADEEDEDDDEDDERRLGVFAEVEETTAQEARAQAHIVQCMHVRSAGKCRPPH